MTSSQGSSGQLTATLRRLEDFGVRLGLDTTTRLLTALGHPERSLRTVLVAGTNGKGSTAALLAGLATHSGYRTGLYTSPHLETVEERLRINGSAIEADTLGVVVEQVVDTAEKRLGYLPTYFEALTAAAFLWFASEAVDLAILEVGLGGRLDATNGADPMLSLITEIGLEHREYLGETLAEIAREKAGILRSGRRGLAWVRRPEARASIQEVAEEIGADVVWAADRVRIGPVLRRGTESQAFDLTTSAGCRRFELRLIGDHQRENLALAVLAAESLAELGFERLAAADLPAAAAAVRWPARLEWVELPGGKQVLLDVAHNPDGGERLARALADNDDPFDLLFGALTDKQPDRFLPDLARRATGVYLTTPNSPRSTRPEVLAAMLPTGPVTVEPDPGAALTAALAGSGRFLLVCGSVYLVGEIRMALRRRFGVPSPAVDGLFGSGPGQAP